MEQNEINPNIEEKPETVPQTWFDLIIYLVGGVGTFIVLSFLIGYLFFSEVEKITLGITVISILLNVVTIGGSYFVFGTLRKRISSRKIGLWPVKWKWSWLIVILVVSFFMNPIRIVAAGVIQQLIEPGMESLQAREDLFTAGGMLTWTNFIVTFIGVGILAPFAEELFFRGLIQGWFREKYSRWIAIACSSVIFGLAHFDSPGVLVSSMMMGFVLGYLYDRYESIWMPIGLHIFTNSGALVLTYLLASIDLESLMAFVSNPF